MQLILLSYYIYIRGHEDLLGPIYYNYQIMTIGHELLFPHPKYITMTNFIMNNQHKNLIQVLYYYHATSHIMYKLCTQLNQVLYFLTCTADTSTAFINVQVIYSAML